MNKANALMVVLMVALVGSCAETTTRWEHPGQLEDTWARDEADCHGLASETAERELQQLEESRGGRAVRSTTLTTKLDVHSAQQRQARLFERCMVNKGYARVPVEE